MQTEFKLAFEKAANLKSIGSAVVNRMGKSTVKGTSGMGKAMGVGLGGLAAMDVASNVSTAMSRPKNVSFKAPSFFSHAR